MNRDKQIKEMAEIIYKETDLYNVDTAYDISTVLHDAGYRKSNEVAREIFEEIEKILLDLKYTTESRYTHVPIETLEEVGNWILHEIVPQTIAELKKKYTEEITEGEE